MNNMSGPSYSTFVISLPDIKCCIYQFTYQLAVGVDPDNYTASPVDTMIKARHSIRLCLQAFLLTPRGRLSLCGSQSSLRM